MYLFHNTDMTALKLILKDGYLKSYSLINGKKSLGEGAGLYTENKFVYFSCINKLFEKEIFSNITMYFNSKLLYNKSFYVSTVHSAEPNNLGEWWTKNDNGKRVKMYKRKYNKNYSKYKVVLKRLYKHSINMYEKAFQVFQQVAVRNKVSLKDLIAIEFKKKFVNDSIIKYITKYYPAIIIKII